MKDVYVFDLGNVVVVPMNIELLYQKLECQVSYKDFLQFFKNDESAKEAHLGKISDEMQIKKILEFTKSKKTIEEYKTIYNSSKNGLFKDTIDIIETLRKTGNQVCLLSNLRKIDFDWFKTVYYIENFDKLFFSYKMQMMKPDKNFYHKMIQELKRIPNQIIFFDDCIKNIKSAKECGINAYCVTGNNIKTLFQEINKGGKHEPR